jgi:translation initiation factor IF-1
MERFDLIQVEGVVTECLKPSLLKARLSNGHHLLAHLEGKLAEKFAGVASEGLIGSIILLELRAFDLSSGRVVHVKLP